MYKYTSTDILTRLAIGVPSFKSMVCHDWDEAPQEKWGSNHIYSGFFISRVPDQNGVSQAWYIVEIYRSGRKPLIFWGSAVIGFGNPKAATHSMYSQYQF